MSHKILLVDDEIIRHTIRDFLLHKGYVVEEADDCAAGLALFQSFHPDLVILDYNLPDGTALDLLPKLKEIDENVPCVLLTGFGSIELAVQAIKAGAEQFLTKPVRMDALTVVVQRILESSRIKRKQTAIEKKQEFTKLDPFLGSSSAIRTLRSQIEKISKSDIPVLIQGETGSGKGVLANYIHSQSLRAGEPFVDLNCGGFSRELLETELFGHEKGAFTGAVSAKQGLLEVANRGTVFLDEIGDIDLAIQPKLLKVLEDKRFRRLGDVQDRKVDIRLVAATHKDLAAMTQNGSFREDLYFRISTIPVRVPPLRERKEDIVQIAEHLLGRITVEMSKGQIKLSDPTLDALTEYAWPGNIRELRNTLERAVLMTESNVLRPQDLAFQFPNKSLPLTNADATLEAMERLHIERVLERCRNEVSAAARILGISRTTLYSKIKEYGLLPSDTEPTRMDAAPKTK